MSDKDIPTLTRKDFVSPLDVRWCPGCGDYAILNTVQKVFAELKIPKEQFAVVSGIGCSSRFPYYMNTYGFHTLHGRAPTVATGIKVSNPDLSVWLVTGDGDGLSIGGNHLMHVLRKNPNINILLFNNRIYGLTKGQYSPTSEFGKVTKSSPKGSVEQPVNPISFALSAEATFVARTLDTNPKHMASVLKAAEAHQGVSFVEIFQNCVIFNDKAFADVSSRNVMADNTVQLENGQPLIFGKDSNKGIRFNGFNAEIFDVTEDNKDQAIVHNTEESNPAYAYALAQLQSPDFPTPIGVFKSTPGKPTFEGQIHEQVEESVSAGKGNLQDLITGKDFWIVEENEIEHHEDEVATESFAVIEEDEINKERHWSERRSQNDPYTLVFEKRIEELLIQLNLNETFTIQVGDSVLKAAQLMKENHIGALPVLESNNIVGIISEHDILHRAGDKLQELNTIEVSEVMTQNPSCLASWSSVAQALHHLEAGNLSHIPVKRDDQSLTFISIKDILTYIRENV